MKSTNSDDPQQAEVVREYGPFAGGGPVNGVTHDGKHVWLARGATLAALDPASGDLVRSLPVAADAGTAFDGRHLWQLAEDRIQQVDPESGRVLRSIPAPAHGRDSGLTWAEGTLWVGEYRARKIHQIDAQTGAVLRTIESDRFVTGVSWVEGELWHATLQDEQSELRRVDPHDGQVLERLALPEGVAVSGLEAAGDLFFCGGAASGKVRAVRRKRARR
jgi:glutamine cyclotransferase